MKSHPVTTAVTALVVGGLSATGATMLANRPSSESRPVTTDQARASRPAARGAARVRTEARLDPCRKLARAISKRALNDASLHKLVSAHPGCRAVLVHSKAPEQTVAVARPVAPRIVSVPAAPATSGTGQSLSVSASHHDDGEAESEPSGDDGGETED